MTAENSWRHYSIVGAIIRRGDRVLLVGHASGDGVAWSLPAGKVEESESATAALCREVREETGLEAASIGPLAYVTNVVRNDHRDTTIAMIFEVEVAGELSVADPDDDVVAAEFVTIPEARARLARIRPEMGEPAIAYLAGQVAAGGFATYIDMVAVPNLVPQPESIG